MYLVYIDDSGDTGLKTAGSPTDAFVLSAVVIRDRDWLNTLDELKRFRQFLYNNFGLRQRDELKASYLIHGNGSFKGLHVNDKSRIKIYDMALRLQDKIGEIQTWAIVIDKKKWDNRYSSERMREIAWTYMIQRIERFTNYGQETCTIYPDEGYPDFVKGLIRKMRRFSRVPSAYDASKVLKRNATFIIEDPNFRKSNELVFSPTCRPQCLRGV